MTVAASLFLNACGALDENVFHRFRYVNTWSPVGGATCGGLGGVTLEEIGHWGLALRV